MISKNLTWDLHLVEWRNTKTMPCMIQKEIEKSILTFIRTPLTEPTSEDWQLMVFTMKRIPYSQFIPCLLKMHLLTKRRSISPFSLSRRKESLITTWLKISRKDASKGTTYICWIIILVEYYTRICHLNQQLLQNQL